MTDNLKQQMIDEMTTTTLELCRADAGRPPHIDGTAQGKPATRGIA